MYYFNIFQQMQEVAIGKEQAACLSSVFLTQSKNESNYQAIEADPSFNGKYTLTKLDLISLSDRDCCYLKDVMCRENKIDQLTYPHETLLHLIMQTKGKYEVVLY